MNSRPALLELLSSYTPPSAEQREVCARMMRFVESTPDCCERSHLPGHMTGSAWIINATGDAVLLMHHKKLDRWMQPGGHADGDFDLLRVAGKEAVEESGIVDLLPVDSRVFDLDIHTIPARKEVPEHLHYDVRFRFRAAPGAEPVANHESNALAWVPLGQVERFTSETSILRMRDRAQMIDCRLNF